MDRTNGIENKIPFVGQQVNRYSPEWRLCTDIYSGYHPVKRACGYSGHYQAMINNINTFPMAYPRSKKKSGSS